MRQVAIASLPLAALVVSGCGQNGDMPGNEAASPSDNGLVNEAAAVPNPDFDPAQPGVGNEYYYIDLLALRDGDGAHITGDAGRCTFYDGKSRPLLIVGISNNSTSRPFGVARPNGKGAQHFNTVRAGSQYVLDGPVMLHDANDTVPRMLIEVRRTEDESRAGDGGTRQWPAELTVSDPDAVRQPYRGTWRCDV